MSSNWAVCTLHGIERPARYMKRQEDNTYQCEESNPCKVRKEPADGKGDADLEDVCDLCNKNIKAGSTIDEHVKENHGTLLAFCNNLVQSADKLQQCKPNSATVDAFGQMICSFATDCDKGKDIFQLAMDARNQLENIVRSRFPKCSVFIFGSCVSTGCWDGRGDVDFSLVDPQGWQDGSWPGNEADVVSKCTRTLRDAGFSYESLQPLLRTRVPIVKHEGEGSIDFDKLRSRYNRTIAYDISRAMTEDEKLAVKAQFSGNEYHLKWEGSKRLLIQFPNCADALKHFMMNHDLILPQSVKYRKRWSRHGYRPTIFSIHFDLSTRAHGIRNSWLLRSYMEQSHEARAASVFIKHWSKRSGINNSMKGYITSYAVNLMWIYYLLQVEEVRFVPTDTIAANPAGRETVGYLHMTPLRSGRPFEQRLANLVAGFFRYYAFEFNWKTEVITVSRPGLTTKQSLDWVESNEVMAQKFRDRVWYRFCIEDPFEPNLNLGRHVSPIKLNKVQSEFLHAYQCLVQQQPESVMLDRSSAQATRACMTFVYRRMVGKTSAQLDDIVEELRQSECSASLAAYEVEHATTDLFAEAGYTIRGDKIVIPDKSMSDLFVPESAIAEVIALDNVFATNRHLGVEATEEMRASNLRLLYFYDKRLRRYFLTENDAKKFNEHYDVVNRMMSTNDQCTIDDLRSSFAESGIALDEDIFDLAVNLVENEMFGNSTPPAPKAVPWQSSVGGAPSKSAQPTPDISRQFNGDCDECKARRVLVCPAKMPCDDKGVYCNACWKVYTSS